MKFRVCWRNINQFRMVQESEKGGGGSFSRVTLVLLKSLYLDPCFLSDVLVTSLYIDISIVFSLPTNSSIGL